MLKVTHEYYELEYNAEKNRIYFLCRGAWTSRAVAPDFMEDWKSVMQECDSDWTILGDLREITELSPDAQDWHSEVQAVIMDRGVRKVAQVAPVEVAGKVRSFSRDSGMKKVLWAFTNPEEAESWLNDEIEIGF